MAEHAAKGGGGASIDYVGTIITGAVLAFIGYFLWEEGVIEVIIQALASGPGEPSLLELTARAWGAIVPYSIFFTLLFLAIIIYSSVRLSQIRAREEHAFEEAQHPVAANAPERVHLRWERILDHVHSENEEAWRLAIIEADIMLNELLDVEGYRGETMADKMRQVERSDWNTIDLAWEAHKVRNQVAHQSGYVLDQREARRIIGLYEQVFREFHFV